MSYKQWSRTAGDNASDVDDVNWAEGQPPSSVNDSAREVMADGAEYFWDNGGGIVATGSANSLTVTSAGALTEYNDGDKLFVRAANTNTGAAVMNVDAVGNKPIRSQSGLALTGGEIRAGGIYIFVYSEAAVTGTGAWILINPSAGNATAILSQTYAWNANTSSLTKNAWTTAPLGTESDPGGIVALATNKFTPVEDCEVQWTMTLDYESASASDLLGFLKTRIYNDTDAVEVAAGTRDRNGVSTSDVALNGSLTSLGRAFLTGGKAYILQFYVSGSVDIIFRYHIENASNAGTDVTTLVSLRR